MEKGLTMQGRGMQGRVEGRCPSGGGEGNSTGQRAERRLLNPTSAPWERHTQRPFEVGDLEVAHPQLGHSFRQCSLLSWDKKSLLLFQNPPPPLPGCPSSPGFPSLPRTGSVLGFPLYSFLPGLSLLLGSEERSEFGATVQGVQWELGMGVRAEDGRKGQRLNWKKGPAGKLGTARLTSSSPTPSPSTRFRLENLQGKRFAASNTSPQRLGSPSWS